jgi:hypothetical protein
MDSGLGTERRTAAFGSTMQLEVLRRLRTGGQQVVRIEHVHINDGGQAVIGNVSGTEPAVCEALASRPAAGLLR